MAKVFNKDVGPLVNLLDTEDVDSFVDTDNEDEL